MTSEYEKLLSLVSKINECEGEKCLICHFPDDLKNFTAYILWAVDKSGKVLVGSGANRIETVESIREFYANDEAKASIDRHNLEE